MTNFIFSMPIPDDSDRNSKRILMEFSPSVERALDKAFGSRGLNKRDSWYLLIVAVDPEYEGQGTPVVGRRLPICALKKKLNRLKDTALA